MKATKIYHDHKMVALVEGEIFELLWFTVKYGPLPDKSRQFGLMKITVVPRSFEKMPTDEMVKSAAAHFAGRIADRYSRVGVDDDMEASMEAAAITYTVGYHACEEKPK